MAYRIGNKWGYSDTNCRIMVPGIEDKRNGYFLIPGDKKGIVNWKGDKFFED